MSQFPPAARLGDPIAHSNANARLLAKVVGMTLSTSDVEIVYSDLTGTPVADCDMATPLPKPTPGGSADIDNGFTIAVTVNGAFNAVVPVTSAFLDGIDLSSTQTRSIFKGVIGD